MIKVNNTNDGQHDILSFLMRRYALRRACHFYNIPTQNVLLQSNDEAVSDELKLGDISQNN